MGVFGSFGVSSVLSFISELKNALFRGCLIAFFLNLDCKALFEKEGISIGGWSLKWQDKNLR